MLIKSGFHESVLDCHLSFTPVPSPPLWDIVTSGTSSSLKLHSLREGVNFNMGHLYVQIPLQEIITKLVSTALVLPNHWVRLTYVIFADLDCRRNLSIILVLPLLDLPCRD